MAGILCNSVSKTMLSGDTAADKVVTEYVSHERISLSVFPTGTTYQWSMAAPTDSATARSRLSDDTGATPTFIPDVAGIYLIACIVDGVTTYVIRVTVTSTAIAHLAEAIRLTPKADTAIPAPAAGRTRDGGARRYRARPHHVDPDRDPLLACQGLGDGPGRRASRPHEWR